MAASSGLAVDVSVTLRGGLFTKDIPRTVQEAIIGEILEKVEERTKRGGKGLGVRRNSIRHYRPGGDALQLQVASTLVWPRTRGTAWQRKNIAVVKAMAPRVARKAAERIALEMGGA